MLLFKRKPDKHDRTVGKKSYHSSTASSAAARELGNRLFPALITLRAGVYSYSLLILGGLLGYCAVIPHMCGRGSRFVAYITITVAGVIVAMSEGISLCCTAALSLAGLGAYAGRICEIVTEDASLVGYGIGFITSVTFSGLGAVSRTGCIII